MFLPVGVFSGIMQNPFFHIHCVKQCGFALLMFCIRLRINTVLSNSFISSESSDKQPIIEEVVHLHLAMKLGFSRNTNRIAIICLHYCLHKHGHKANTIGLFSKHGLKAVTSASNTQWLWGTLTADL